MIPSTVTSSQGVDLALHDLGGAGAPILFAHATGFCGPIWAPVAEHLADHRCWALDFRCHGRSTRPVDDDLSWRGTGDDVLSVVDALGLIEPVGVGHSMGGAALLLAEQRRPGTFAALWLFEPIVIPAGSPLGDPESNPLSIGAARRRETFDSIDAAYANFASKPPMAAFDPRSLRAYVDGGFEELPDGTARLRCRAADESRFYLMGAHHGASEHLGEVRCPVTVVRGAAEPGPFDLAPPVAEGVVDGTLIDLPSVSHFGPMEDPALIAAEIRQLLTTTA